jgi:hypothetical protein
MLRSTTASRAATFDPPTEASINVPAPSSSGTGAAATLGQPVAAKKEKEPVVIEEEPMPTLNDRDLVQTMVRDNPEMAVAIIGKWLQGAR